ncbi:MAG TPA: MarP family serine protease [Acidimicrobiia bacterium]|nr:MarP family serine protease [Acidimicrobiia bacterium]
MNVLDVVIVAAAGAAGYFGYRLGFVARVASWVGLAIGVTLAVAFVDDVLDPLSSQPSQTRLLIALAFFLVLASAGQALGFAVGIALRRRLPARAGVHRSDRIGGAVVGVIGVLVAVWLLVPALTSASGWPARAARDSQIVRAINRYAPDPPPQAERLGRRVAEGPFPEVFSRLNGPGDVGAPPTKALAPDVAARVASSTVRVEGEACDQIQAGSGWVAGSDLVVTNAHVVSGERNTHVETNDGRRLAATVVAFDPGRDVAVLRIRNLRLFALPRADGRDGMAGGVFGYPGGGPLVISPARIAETVNAAGTDIYRTGRTRRQVFVIAAELRPGDSGGPLVDQSGRVVGVAFAIDPGQDATAYALTRAEFDAVLGPVLNGGGQSAVGAGPCLVG